jgi:protein-S-isoprenylcysteine O-methyltransferase Ste14
MPKRLSAALAGIIIYLGIPLSTWGIGDVSRFMQHPARVTYLLVTVLTLVLVVAFVPNAGLSRKEGTTVVARQRIALLGLQIFPLGIMIIAPWSDSRAWGVFGSDAVRYAGVVLYAAGTFIMNWSIVFLGRHFSVQVTLQRDHRLVTEGPYRYVRHPRYAGILFCFLGIALVFGSIGALVLEALLVLTLLWRVRDEEALMASAFPDEWPGYTRKTARLVPGIY